MPGRTNPRRNLRAALDNEHQNGQINDTPDYGSASDNAVANDEVSCIRKYFDLKIHSLKDDSRDNAD